MMIITAKVDLKKILTVVGIVVLLLIGAIWLFGGDEDSTTTAAPAGASNEQRVQYLKNFGWDVTATPVETSQVKIPSNLGHQRNEASVPIPLCHHFHPLHHPLDVLQ